MKIRFEEKMNNRYMIICPDRSESGFSAYTYRMILENRIRGIAPCRTGNMDGRPMLYYNVTGMIQLSEYLREHAADEVFFKRFLRELASAVEELQRFLIGSESIFMDPEQIFVSSDIGSFRFAVCFEDRNPFSDNLLKLSEYLIPRLPNNNRTAAAIGYELYQSCISGQVTAGSLRTMADYEIGRETADRQTAEKEEIREMIISEDDIFTAGRKKAKKKKQGSLKEVLLRKAGELKEGIGMFIRSISDEER